MGGVRGIHESEFLRGPASGGINTLLSEHNMVLFRRRTLQLPGPKYLVLGGLFWGERVAKYMYIGLDDATNFRPAAVCLRRKAGSLTRQQ